MAAAIAPLYNLAALATANIPLITGLTAMGVVSAPIVALSDKSPSTKTTQTVDAEYTKLLEKTKLVQIFLNNFDRYYLDQNTLI